MITLTWHVSKLYKGHKLHQWDILNFDRFSSFFCLAPFFTLFHTNTGKPNIGTYYTAQNLLAMFQHFREGFDHVFLFVFTELSCDSLFVFLLVL